MGNRALARFSTLAFAAIHLQLGWIGSIPAFLSRHVNVWVGPLPRGGVRARLIQPDPLP